MVSASFLAASHPPASSAVSSPSSSLADGDGTSPRRRRASPRPPHPREVPPRARSSTPPPATAPTRVPRTSSPPPTPLPPLGGRRRPDRVRRAQPPRGRGAARLVRAVDVVVEGFAAAVPGGARRRFDPAARRQSVSGNGGVSGSNACGVSPVPPPPPASAAVTRSSFGVAGGARESASESASSSSESAEWNDPDPSEVPEDVRGEDPGGLSGTGGAEDAFAATNGFVETVPGPGETPKDSRAWACRCLMDIHSSTMRGSLR